jgi:tyrosyl-tRNA synthetase
MPATSFRRPQDSGLQIVDLLVRTGLAASKREARDLLAAGAISINGHRIAAADATLMPGGLRFGRFVIIRKGRKTYHAATFD